MLIEVTKEITIETNKEILIGTTKGIMIKTMKGMLIKTMKRIMTRALFTVSKIKSLTNKQTKNKNTRLSTKTRKQDHRFTQKMDLRNQLRKL